MEKNRWSNWYAREMNGTIHYRDEIFEMPPGAKRVFHDGQYQGWEIKNTLFILSCFLEKERVGKLLFYIQNDDSGKKLVDEIVGWMRIKGINPD